MDEEDKRRYFVVGSVYLEVVTPLFQQKLLEKYQGLEFGCLKDFLNNKEVIHILFHLRYRNKWCCTDKAHCTNQKALPLNHHQWKQLYDENPGPGIHNCFCKYTARSVTLENLDVSLCGLILYNCCKLEQLEVKAVQILRRKKNDYLSHNTTCGITKDEYDPLMDDLETNILQLDQTKKDELIRIQKRPLDDSLCSKYTTILLDIHEILEKIDTKIELSTNQILDTVNMNNAELTAKIEICASIQEVDKTIQRIDTTTNEIDRRVQRLDQTATVTNTAVMGIQATMEICASIQEVDKTIQRIDTTTNEIDRRVQRLDQTATVTNTAVMGIQDTMEELLYYAKRGIPCQCSTDKCQQVKKVKKSIKSYKLGKNIFTLHHQKDLSSKVNSYRRSKVIDTVMMDDGRLVMCFTNQDILLICNTDGSKVDKIDVQGKPLHVTAVNNSTVAVIMDCSNSIEIYDINTKIKLKSISVTEMCWWISITTVNNKLVVGAENKLLIIDHQTGEVVQTIKTGCYPIRLHGSGNRIFYCNFANKKNLYWYSYTDDRHHTLALPLIPESITTLQDGSLYVVCACGWVYHVSSDGKKYKLVNYTFLNTIELGVIHYNLIQRKLVIRQGACFRIFNQK